MITASGSRGKAGRGRRAISGSPPHPRGPARQPRPPNPPSAISHEVIVAAKRRLAATKPGDDHRVRQPGEGGPGLPGDPRVAAAPSGPFPGSATPTAQPAIRHPPSAISHEVIVAPNDGWR